MIKKKTIETVEEFDQNGKLIKKTTTETITEDDTSTYPLNIGPYNPYTPSITWIGDPPPVRYDQVTCECNMPEDCETCTAGCRQ